MPAVHNPLMHVPPANRDANWEAVKTVEPPRKCLTCHTVYPSDDPYCPMRGDTLCFACWAKGGGHETDVS